MDEKQFFEALDEKLKYYLEPIMDFIDTQKAIRDFNLSDKSKSDRPRQDTDKEIIGEYTIAKKGCNRCGGKITWDNYEKINDAGFPQKYPDHVSDDGYLIECPEYIPK